jgi:hypothetical protein
MAIAVPGRIVPRYLIIMRRTRSWSLIGRRDVQGQQMAQRVHGRMNLRSFASFGPISSLRSDNAVAAPLHQCLFAYARPIQWKVPGPPRDAIRSNELSATTSCLTHAQCLYLSTIRRFALVKSKESVDTSIELVSASHGYRLALRGLSMQIMTKSGRTSIRVVMGIVFLALAVFGWGVKYKISLYDSPGSISSHMSHAKLLSQRERPVSSNNLDLVRPSLLDAQPSISDSAFFIAAIALILCCTASIRMLTRAQDGDPYRRRCSFNSIYFFFRPPPAQLPSLLE